MFSAVLLLLKNHKIAVAVAIATAFAVVIGGAVYFYKENIALHEQLATVKAQKDSEAVRYQTQISSLQTTLEFQNRRIVQFLADSEARQKEVETAQTTVERLRRENRDLIRRLRATPVADQTCEQAVDMLLDSTKELSWGEKK
jgi:uncharacterized protein HemX